MSCFSTTKSSSSTSRSGLDHDVLANEENISFEKTLHKWELPEIPTEKIYKKDKSRFGRRSYSSRGYSIKTIEGESSVKDGAVSVAPLDGVTPWGFRSLHVGMVQVGVKALSAKLSNASVILCLCDGKVENFADSILGMVESSLSAGPVYFNCFPNFTVPLYKTRQLGQGQGLGRGWIVTSPENLSDVLKLIMIVKDSELLSDSKPLTLSYRICCKFMYPSVTSPMALMESPVGKSTVHQINIRSNACTSKLIKWDEVELPAKLRSSSS